MTLVARSMQWHTMSSWRCASRQSPPANASATPGKPDPAYSFVIEGELMTCLYLYSKNACMPASFTAASEREKLQRTMTLVAIPRAE